MDRHLTGIAGSTEGFPWLGHVAEAMQVKAMRARTGPLGREVGSGFRRRATGALQPSRGPLSVGTDQLQWCSNRFCQLEFVACKWTTPRKLAKRSFQSRL
ncbi:unnamed protein product [Effrenium voratum]|nr:unnamed protein product [Effrenium voratum]